VPQIIWQLRTEVSYGSSRRGGAWAYRIGRASHRWFCNLCDKGHKPPSRAPPSAKNQSAFHGRRGTASTCLNCGSPHIFVAGPSAQTGRREYPHGTPRNPGARNGTIPRLPFRPVYPACDTPRNPPLRGLPATEMRSWSDRNPANPSRTLRYDMPRTRPPCRQQASAPCAH